MTKIPIITQNFSSPDVFTDTPLMLLPQGSTSPLPDRDQEGFSQLLLHDLHRHRQSFVRSYTAFETLKKRQDFVLRQENLRSLQTLENRIQAKQDQFVDQSIHSYEQCFVKVINGNLNTPGHPQESGRRIKSADPLSDKIHLHPLSHATPLDSPSITAFHRYQRSHRPPKYRSQTSLLRSAQSFHDAFQSSSFSSRSQPFLSFTESYLQKYADRSTSKYPYELNEDDEMDEIKEILNEEYQSENVQQTQQQRSGSAQLTRTTNMNRKFEKKPKLSELQRVRATISSRNTNTPISSPQMGYHDAVRDGLITSKDTTDQNTKTIISNEKRRSSQQSISQLSSIGSKSNTKRPKTGKKKQVVVNLISDKQSDSKTDDNNLFKSAMFVQNYDSTSTTNSTIPSKIERTQIPVNSQRKPTSILRRSSIKSIDETIKSKKNLDNIDTQMTTTERLEQFKLETNNQFPTDALPTISTVDTKQQQQQQNGSSIDQRPPLEHADNRKHVRKGAFDATDSMTDLVQFELGLLGNNRGAMRKNRFPVGKENNLNGEEPEMTPENKATFELLEKIRQSIVGLAIGQPPVSQQSCRFELPHDLKLLENLTPLEYLSKYCRLSSRRHHQYKRVFDKYRNNQYRFESTNLYRSIVDVYSETFTRTQFEELCQLIDLGNEQHEFTFDTFAGILALCERFLFDSSKFRNVLDDNDLAKHPIEQCDFDSLDRKFDGLEISDTLKRLLKKL